MSANREKIIERIQKLLAMQKSPNENEASVAAEKAQALLAEYNLTLADVRPGEKVEEARVNEGTPESFTTSYPWRRKLANAVAQVYFCEYYYVTYLKGKTRYDQHNFIGFDHNTAVARMVFEYLEKTVDRLAREGALKVPPKQRSPYRVSFRTGCTRRLCGRLWDRCQAAKTQTTTLQLEDGTTKNLPALQSVYEQAEQANLNAVAKLGFEMVQKTSKLAVISQQGLEDGEEAGDSIGLDVQITGKTATHLIGKA